jgi:ATP adenylyltransferase
METLWAPWRLGYVVGDQSDEAKPLAQPPHPTGCIFCDKPQSGDDAAHLIVARATRCFVMLNLYPYNNGHLLVAPYRHVARLEDLGDDECAELMTVARRTVRVVRAGMNAEGFNIGMNVGRVAGAGIDAHLHLHIVPRWSGDANFMPVVSDTKVMPQSLASVRETLAGPLQTALSELSSGS